MTNIERLEEIQKEWEKDFNAAMKACDEAIEELWKLRQK